MKKQLLRIVAAVGVLPFIFASCLDTPEYVPTDYDAVLATNLSGVDKAQLTIDTAKIDDFLEENAVANVLIDPKGGVRYTISSLGTGDKPRVKDGVAIKYEVILMEDGLEGVPFDDGNRLETYLYNVIMGLQTTLPLIPEGSEVQLYIPSGLAYGARDVADSNGDIVIPKNSNLIFRIELLEVFRVPD